MLVSSADTPGLGVLTQLLTLNISVKAAHTFKESTTPYSVHKDPLCDLYPGEALSEISIHLHIFQSKYPREGIPQLSISSTDPRAFTMAQPFLDELFHVNQVLSENPDDRNCVVCLREIGIMNRDTGFTESRLRLPCAHIIGSGCLITWLKESNTCPICRREFFPAQPPPDLENGPREGREDQGQERGDDANEEEEEEEDEEEEEEEEEEEDDVVDNGEEEQYLLNDDHLEIVKDISDSLALHLPLTYPYNVGQWIDFFADELEREFKPRVKFRNNCRSLGTACVYIACMFIGCNTSRKNVVAAAPGILATMDAGDTGLVDEILEKEDIIFNVVVSYLLDESRNWENPGYR